MTFPVLSANTPTASYNLTRSLRFRRSVTAYLSKNYATTATNLKIQTFSFWVKRGTLSATQYLFGGYDGTSTGSAYMSFQSDDTIKIAIDPNGTSFTITTQVFRDPSAWYHIVLAVDTTQATASNRIKLYINGVQVTAVTGTYPSLNVNSQFGLTNNNNSIGDTLANANSFDGYLAEFNFVDGQALTPSSFGSTNSTTGVWQPAKYTGTYGTNGFYLPFTNTTSTTTLGYDSSGNSNNWTPNNISLTAGATYDSMTDVPTLTSATAANFATLNPLGKSTYASMAGGNLNISWSNNASANLAANPATISLPSSGKWYFELSNISADGNNGVGIGICNVTQIANGGDSAPGTYYLYRSDANNSFNGYYSNAGAGSTGTTFIGGAVCGIAVDLDNGKFWAAVNNTWQGGGNPASGTSPGYSGISNSVTWVPFVGGWNWTGTATSASINFGQRPFSYTPPSGFVSLNTYNLPASTIQNGASYMAATTYSGTSATQNVLNTVGSTSFQPDLVWIKNRSFAFSHYLNDSVRGAYQTLFSNLTNAEFNGTSTSDGVSTFNSNGFTLLNGTNADNFNKTGSSYVAWNWKAGGTAVSNTNGSITSSVSANTTSGFSVVTYTGNGTAGATIGHGLGVAPSMVIVKRRDGVIGWPVGHTSIGWTNQLELELTIASTAYGGFNNTAPTSSVVTASGSGSINASGATYVMYCFAAIKGFSAFGSYTGNGSSDGTFVYTGFRPRFLMLKRTDSTGNWNMYDTSRSPSNPNYAELYANLANAEDNSDADFDYLSNGFKLRANAASTNASGGTYIYVAFAQNPFQNALAY